MSTLLPRTAIGTVRRVQPVEIHGDRYVDVTVELDDSPGAPVTARLGAADCPAELSPGERVDARLVMGQLLGVKRSAP